MPTAACHSFFWEGAGGAAPPATGASAEGGYVPWQTTVIMGSGFGVMQIAVDWVAQWTQTWNSHHPAAGVDRWQASVTRQRSP